MSSHPASQRSRITLSPTHLLTPPRPFPRTGIELRGRERKSRGIDYNAEVAFEKKPAPGFYDTGAETAMTKDMQQEFRPTTVEEMEGKRRKVGGWDLAGWRRG